MPYADPQKRKEYNAKKGREWYLANRESVLARKKERLAANARMKPKKALQDQPKPICKQCKEHKAMNGKRICNTCKQKNESARKREEKRIRRIKKAQRKFDKWLAKNGYIGELVWLKLWRTEWGYLAGAPSSANGSNCGAPPKEWGDSECVRARRNCDNARGGWGGMYGGITYSLWGPSCAAGRYKTQCYDGRRAYEDRLEKEREERYWKEVAKRIKERKEKERIQREWTRQLIRRAAMVDVLKVAAIRMNSPQQ